ncbi:hypothetical protein G6F37_005594 [Rhizopus arrhizus]|nr:hypothetical protein G6F38_005809 [Rhizopus arrhizus]KAG1158656.1 hypothetical protein G6F37_005594 [Rhizopus arrhizus]
MDIRQAFNYFYLLEKQFWSSLDKSTIEHVTFQGELSPEDMLLYGEFGFTLLKLKPCVLIEFRDKKVTQLYCEQVIVPVLHALADKTIGYFMISEQVNTPESALEGSILVYQYDHKEILSLFDHSTTVPEETMADILDYPGHLPRSEKEIPTMKTVIYFHDRNTTRIALTTFAIQDNEKDITSSHFERYRYACKEQLDIDLKLLIQ